MPGFVERRLGLVVFDFFNHFEEAPQLGLAGLRIDLGFHQRLMAVPGARRAGVLLSVVPFAIAGWLLNQALAAGPVLEWSHAWMPSMGIELALRVGGFERSFRLC